jgi:hypothetical protein
MLSSVARKFSAPRPDRKLDTSDLPPTRTLTQLQRLCRGNKTLCDPPLNTEQLQRLIENDPDALLRPTPTAYDVKKPLPIHLLAEHEDLAETHLDVLLAFEQGRQSAKYMTTQLQGYETLTAMPSVSGSPLMYLCANAGKLNRHSGERSGGVTLAMIKRLHELDGDACKVSDMQSYFPLFWLCQNEQVQPEMFNFVLNLHPAALVAVTKQEQSAVEMLAMNKAFSDPLLQCILRPIDGGHTHLEALKTSFGDTPLAYYLIQSQKPCLSVVMAYCSYYKGLKGMNPKDPLGQDSRNSYGYTPLANAIVNSNLVKVADLYKFVLKECSGQERIQSTSNKNYPLHLLCYSAFAKLSPQALEDLIVMYPAAAMYQNVAGTTPLHYLCQSKNCTADALRVYLTFASEASLVKDCGGDTPIDLIMRNDHMEVRMLLEFIRMASNPLQMSLQMQQASLKAARRNISRRTLLLQTATMLSEIGAHLVRRLPKKEHTVDYGTTRPYWQGQLMLRPELMLSPQEEILSAVRGPAAIAAELNDADFLSAEFVQNYFDSQYRQSQPLSAFDHQDSDLHAKLNRISDALERWVLPSELPIPLLWNWNFREWQHLREIGQGKHAVFWRDLRGHVPSLSFCFKLVDSTAKLIRNPAGAAATPAGLQALEFVNRILVLAITAQGAAFTGSNQSLDEYQVLYQSLYGLGMTKRLVHLSQQCGSMANFFGDPFNVIDLVVAVNALVVAGAALTFVSPGVLQQCLLCINMCFLWLSLLSVLQFHRTLGPLIGVIFNMGKLLGEFLLITFVVSAGFGCALHYLLGESISDFSTAGGVASILFSAALGDFDLHFQPDDGHTSELEEGQVLVATGLLTLYLIAMPVMLLNLLVAVLTDAYAKVSEDKIKEYQSTRAKAILFWQHEARHQNCPSPFNLVSLLPTVDNGLWLRLVLLLGLGPPALAMQFLPALLFWTGPLIWAAHSRGRAGFWQDKMKMVRPDVLRAMVGTLFMVTMTPFAAAYVYLYQITKALVLFPFKQLLDCYGYYFMNSENGSAAERQPWEPRLAIAREYFQSDEQDEVAQLIDEISQEVCGGEDDNDHAAANTRRKIARLGTAVHQLQVAQARMEIRQRHILASLRNQEEGSGMDDVEAQTSYKVHSSPATIKQVKIEVGEQRAQKDGSTPRKLSILTRGKQKRTAV